jgi:guanylate cyclase
MTAASATAGDPGRWRDRLAGLLDRLAELGSLPEDPEEERVRKGGLVLTACLIAPLAVVWVAIYFVLGRPLSAAIPLAYTLASAAGLLLFVRTKRFRLFRSGQLAMMLALPFLLQWSLGGFGNSSGVMVWAFTAPVGALIYLGPRRAVPWFGAYVALAVVSGLLDPTLARHTDALPRGVVVAFFVLNIFGVSLAVYSVMHYFVQARERAAAALARERERSERLLLNVLPEPIAARLKEESGVIADAFDDVTVLFADIVDFTRLSSRVPPDEVVRILDGMFSVFDRLADRFGLEKIKTIGDAYMVAGGLPMPRPDHTDAMARMALAMRDAVAEREARAGQPMAIRIGMDAGPVVAGVIGTRKFIYDLWGDTVNTASRMESHGLPGAIQVTDRVYDRLRDRYLFECRGGVPVKGKGEMTTYLLIRPLTEKEGQP